MKSEKLKSRKFWIALWSMLMITIALILRIDLPWFNGLAPILGGIIAVYVGINGYLEGKNRGINRTEVKNNDCEGKKELPTEQGV